MATLQIVVDGFVCQRDYNNATLGRLQFWTDQPGHRELANITPDDAPLIRLDERGKLRAGRGLATGRTGKPLVGSSLIATSAS